MDNSQIVADFGAFGSQNDGLPVFFQRFVQTSLSVEQVGKVDAGIDVAGGYVQRFFVHLFGGFGVGFGVGQVDQRGNGPGVEPKRAAEISECFRLPFHVQTEFAGQKQRAFVRRQRTGPFGGCQRLFVFPLFAIQQAYIIRNQCVVRVLRRQFLQRRNVVFRFCQVGARFGVSGVEQCGLIILFTGPFGLPEAGVKVAERIAGFLDARLQLQGAEISLDRLGRFAAPFFRPGEVKVIFRRLRILLNGPGKKRYRLFVQPFALGDQSQQVEHVRVIGGRFQNLPVKPFGFVQPTFVAQFQRLPQNQIV